MDRHNSLHKASRVTLPFTVSLPSEAANSEFNAMSQRARRAGVRSNVTDVLARVGLLTCGLVVIATASLLALWVN